MGIQQIKNNINLFMQEVFTQKGNVAESQMVGREGM